MADVKALVVRLEADLKGLKAGMAEASGEITKFTGQSNALGQSSMRNWRMANQMGDSFRGAALSMGGMRGQGVMVLGMLDNIQDYFERAKIRGLGFRDALKNLSGEMSMMLTAGVVYGLMQAFNALQKSIEETNKVLAETQKGWDQLTVNLYENKLKRLKKQYDDNKISAEQYRESAENLSQAIVRTKYQEEIAKTTEAIKKLGDAQVRLAVIQSALSSSKAGGLIAGLFGADVDAKMAAMTSKLRQLESTLAQETKMKIDEVHDHIDTKTKERKKKDKDTEKQELMALSERLRKEGAIKDKAIEDYNDKLKAQRDKSVKDFNDALEKEKEERKEQIDRIDGYYSSAAGSIASLTTSLLNREKDAWKNWADNIIKQIERVIAKELILAAIKGLTGLGPGGFVGGIWGDIGKLFSSPGGAGVQPSIQIITADPGTIVRVINKAYGSATPGAQAQLSQVVARGNIVNAKR